MNKTIPAVLDEYISGLINHDVAAVARTVAEDLLFISATRILGKPQFLDLLSALYAGFPDWIYEYTEIEDRGQQNYAIKWHQGGTHTGTWAMPGMQPLPATGKHVRIPPHYFFYR
ncbi:MAG: ester cyclase, partial [Burkholderiales bacterium]